LTFIANGAGIFAVAAIITFQLVEVHRQRSPKPAPKTL
jgi:hypothetical protein